MAQAQATVSLPVRHESVVAAVLLNLVESGYRIIDPSGADITEATRCGARDKLGLPHDHDLDPEAMDGRGTE